MTIAQVIKEIEHVKINGNTPTGTNKKAVVIELGRILIKEINEPDIVMVYNIIAEQIIESMIDVSKSVNQIQDIPTVCCPSIFDLFKRKV